VPADGALASSGANGIGQRDVVVEDDPELDHAEQEQGEDRQDESELRHRLPLLISERKSLCDAFHAVTCDLIGGPFVWEGPASLAMPA
jgi:hypothetical protein